MVLCYLALESLNHDFIKPIMTCIGIEVLGYIILGFDESGESKIENTIKIYQMLDPKLQEELSEVFFKNYVKVEVFCQIRKKLKKLSKAMPM